MPPPLLTDADDVARHNRADVYLGVVAPTGVQRATFARALGAALRRFGYALSVWRLSDLLDSFADVAVRRDAAGAYLQSAMDAGTRLRRSVGADCLVRAAMLAISKARANGDHAPRAHLIWSLKHPSEVTTLRLTYGASFHLLGLWAAAAERRQSLLGRAGMTGAEADAAMARDEDESGRSHGQRTRDTFQLADVFLPWGRAPDRAGMLRFLDLVFGCPLLTPSLDEHRMFLASASACRSGEMSRQVGAVLTDAHGDVLAVGSNDVPRRGGGPYWPGAGDQRDLQKGHDANTAHRRRLMRDVARELGVAEPEAFAARLERTSLHNLTEYGRAVHAEMDALLACARTGRPTRGTTLYVTTYPCHNCARHLIAAGVQRVVFVEPYPKSRALQLHQDDLVEVVPGSGADRAGRVRLEPFVGIGPRRFLDYFSTSLGSGYLVARKQDDGRVVRWARRRSAPRVQSTEGGYLATEQLLATEVLPFLKR